MKEEKEPARQRARLEHVGNKETEFNIIVIVVPMPPNWLVRAARSGLLAHSSAKLWKRREKVIIVMPVQEHVTR